MIGLCSGNVRSTPVPKLTLRTVNASWTPAPVREITTPAKTWIRERLPSTTRTCTRTVSPGRKAGISVRRDAASNSAISLLMSVLASATGHFDRWVSEAERTVPLWQEPRLAQRLPSLPQGDGGEEIRPFRQP